MLTTTYSDPLHPPKLSSNSANHRLSTATFSSLSHPRREASSDRERGGTRPCPNPRPFSEGEPDSMSQNPLHTGPLYDNAPLPKDHSVIDNKHASAGNRNPARRPPIRARPQSWHPYAPVEPPLETSQLRPFGVHAILNPPTQAPAEAGSSSRDPLSLPGAASSTRPRQGSSPVPRPGPSITPQPLSPRSHAPPLANPGSPSARFMGGSRSSGQSSVTQSPLVAQEPSMGPRPPAASSPVPLDSMLRPITSLPGTQAPVSASLRSTPSLHSRQTSAGPSHLPNPSSQEPSPNQPQASFNQIGRASPAVIQGSVPPSATAALAPYMTMDQVSRGLPATTGPRLTVEEPAGLGVTTQSTPVPGLIPCVLDLKSGSLNQAEKRKANSDASRRFRNRKRNEMQLEQRLNSQQEEIQRYTETVRRQNEEIRTLIQQRDHYRSERDFYRDHLGRTMPLSQLGPRPPSPRPAPSVIPLADTPSAPAWSAGDASRSTSGSQPGSAGPGPVGAQGSWLGTSASYSPASLPPAGRGIPGPPLVAGSSLPPLQGAWSRP